MTSQALSIGSISFFEPSRRTGRTGGDYGNGVVASAASACTRPCPAAASFQQKTTLTKSAHLQLGQCLGTLKVQIPLSCFSLVSLVFTKVLEKIWREVTRKVGKT